MAYITIRPSQRKIGWYDVFVGNIHRTRKATLKGAIGAGKMVLKANGLPLDDMKIIERISNPQKFKVQMSTGKTIIITANSKAQAERKVKAGLVGARVINEGRIKNPTYNIYDATGIRYLGKITAKDKSEATRWAKQKHKGYFGYVIEMKKTKNPQKFMINSSPTNKQVNKYLIKEEDRWLFLFQGKKIFVSDTTKAEAIKNARTYWVNRMPTKNPQKLRNPTESIKSGEWTPAHAVRIRKGKLEIMR
jgi:hypothetical protein